MNRAASAAANPAATFYTTSRAARWVGQALRLADRLAPRLATTLALRLFFTPLPLKTAARRRATPAGWTPVRRPFERGAIVLWQRRDADPARTRVLLVHGWAGDAMQMRPLGEAVAAAGYEPLLLDFPAHGASDGWRSTLPQFVRTLFAVQAHTGPLAALIGHSLGALAASHAAAQGLAVQRLVLLAPSAPPATVLRWFGQLFGIGAVLGRRMHEAIERREGLALRQFEPAWLGARLHQPVLVVHDHGDRAAPLAHAQALVDALPCAEFHVTQGLSHRRVLTDPAVAARVTAHLGRPKASPL